MKVKIHVTQEDIDKGEECILGSAYNCPIALAIRRQLGFKLLVGSSRPIFPDGLGMPLPRSAQRFIKRFDKEQEVKPFNFILDVPEDE